MRRWIFAAAIVVLSMASIGPAAGQHVNASSSPCRSDVSVACNRAALERADRDLNATYTAIRLVLSVADRARMQTLEHSWLGYRDTFCAAEYDLYSGGSGGPIARLACLEALTRHQQIELNEAYGWRLVKVGQRVP